MGRASLIVLLFNKEVPERERLDALLLLFIEDFLATLQREFKNQFQITIKKCIEKKKNNTSNYWYCGMHILMVFFKDFF